MAELHTGFDCNVCGQRHDVLPLSFSVKEPLVTAGIPFAQRQQRLSLTADQCVVDGRRFFLRGRIVIPIHELAEPFVWGVWSELSPKAFLRAHELWQDPERIAEPPAPGWLANHLPLYGETLNLELRLHTQPVGRRPHFVLCESEHPLAREQKEGISLKRAEQIAAAALHARLLPVRDKGL